MHPLCPSQAKAGQAIVAPGLHDALLVYPPHLGRVSDPGAGVQHFGQWWSQSGKRVQATLDNCQKECDANADCDYFEYITDQANPGSRFPYEGVNTLNDKARPKYTKLEGVSCAHRPQDVISRKLRFLQPDF